MASDTKFYLDARLLQKEYKRRSTANVRAAVERGEGRMTITTCQRRADGRLTRTMETWVEELPMEQLLGQQPEGSQRLSELPD